MKDERKAAPPVSPLPLDIVPRLVAWYRENRREFPWRNAPDAYRVWISEIMLQQTRIEAAMPYYERFLKTFPDVQALASSPEDVLLKQWQGLGYYSRARNLKKAAERICENYGGKLPKEASELRKLPGIGDYTAGAIASIAYGQPEPAVDGNVLRVYMRLVGCFCDVMLPPVRKAVTEHLRQVYPSGEEASLFTEALMELGETVCIPNGEPKCDACPLRSLCLAAKQKTTQEIPVRSPAKARRVEQRTILLLSCGDTYALTKRGDGLLGGLWEYPNLEGALSEDDVRDYLKRQGLRTTLCRPCGDAVHVFSHVEWHMRGYRVTCESPDGPFTWKTAAAIEDDYAIPSAFRFYRKLMLKEQD